MGIIDESKRARGNGLNFLHNKKLLIVIAVVLIAGGAYKFWPESDSKGAEGQATVKEWTVKKDDIVISVEADGQVVAEDGVELSFGVNDDNLEVTEVLVKEGDTVKKGDKIASVETDSLELSLRSSWSSYESALATYNETMDGATDDEIQDAKDKIKSAEISLEQSKRSLDNTKQNVADNIQNAEKALEDARENMEDNKSVDTSKDVADAYESLIDAIKSVSIALENDLPESDNIIGVDNESINDSFEDNLGVKDKSSINNAKISYKKVKNAKNELDSLSVILSYSSGYVEVEEATDLAVEVLRLMEQHLYDMQTMLNASITSSNFSKNQLDSFKSTINSNRSSIINRITSLNSNIENVDDAKDKIEDYADDYTDALRDLENTKADAERDIANAEESIVTKEMSLEQANRSYDELMAPLTAEELASARSRLTSASVSLTKARNELEKADIISPIDGQVVELNYKVGDIIVDNDDPVAVILNNETLFVEVNVEEADVSQLKVGQKAVAIFDALDELELEGEVSFISLTSNTNNNGIVTYEVRVLINNPSVVGSETEKQIREGMTATIEFISQEVKDVLTAPVAAIRNVNGKPSAQLESGEWTPVTTGFTDGKTVEIIAGLNEGDEILY